MKTSFVTYTALLCMASYTCEAATVAVPNVVNLTQAAAQNAITSDGLTVGTITTAPSNAIVNGNVISESPAAGTSVNSGSAVNLVVSIGSPQFLPAGQNNAVSDLISAQSGTLGSTTLPAGQNEAVSKIFSAQNGVIGSETLPTGRNEAVSKIFSAQNGVLGSEVLPAGQNEAVSKIFSAQNGTIGSLLLPTGQNEAVSKLIAAAMNDSSNAQALLKSSLNYSAGSGSATNASGASLSTAVLVAGETVTISSDVPAQISLNGVRAGNDPGSLTDLTFVVPENLNAIRVRAGASADTAVMVRPETRVLTGLVVDASGAPQANALVHLRHQGLKAEFYQLTPNSPKDELPNVAALKPNAEEPVSSLNMHDPKQAFGYFPVGTIAAPDFAVRLSGQFLASTAGSYSFSVAATEAAQLTIDGVPQPVVRNTVEGLESAVPVKLAKGWHSLELLAYAGSTSAEVILSSTPPGGAKQLIGANLLRSESSVLTAVTGNDGKFSVTAPAWLTQVEAMATSTTGIEHFSGISSALDVSASSFERVQLTPDPSL